MTEKPTTSTAETESRAPGALFWYDKLKQAEAEDWSPPLRTAWFVWCTDVIHRSGSTASTAEGEWYAGSELPFQLITPPSSATESRSVIRVPRVFLQIDEIQQLLDAHQAELEPAQTHQLQRIRDLVGRPIL